MVENIKQSEFNKNVIQVYTQEANFTGYKGFDFTAIDDLEYLIRAELIPYASGIKSSIDQGVNTNQLDLNYITDNVSISGRALTYLSGIANAGVNVNQLDLNYITDNVSISGQALSYLSGIANAGVNVNQSDLNYITDNVSISGQALSYLSGIALDFSKNNGVQTLLNALTVTGENIPSGITVYQANLNKDLDNISTSPIQSSTISNSTVSGSNGTIFAANQNRLELFVQNLATGALYVKYGASGNNTSFNFVLAANSASDAGDGGSLSDQAYTGIVSVSGAVGPSYICWERS